MNLLKHEIFKLLRSPAIYGFLIACLLINVFAIIGSSNSYQIDYINDLSKTTGHVYGDEYLEKLLSVTDPDLLYYNWLHAEIVRAAESAHNVFAELDGGRVFRNMLQQDEIPFSETTIKIQLWKYEKLAPVIEEKAERDDGASVYFGPYSMWVHSRVFGGSSGIGIGMLTAMQTCLFFILIMLWTLGFENMAGTDLVVWSTKTGRRLILHKVAAALLIGTAYFIVTYAVTYGITFAVNDFSQVWSQNVSAQYNVVQDQLFGQIPFITWRNMTVGGYFFASAGIVLLNGIVAAFLTIPFALLIRNVYVAFCTIAGITVVHFILFVFGIQPEGAVPFIWNFSMILPLMQVINNGIWFTDGGIRMLLPHFETLYPLICLLLLCPVIFISTRKFLRKEIV